ncbi:MAG: histidine phosphatase family protein [Candidatus Eremiobacteraeota bacterium]|nr:histidine phosphatase family protein [Candidatus Eremiobacteraeota bacterium]
MRHGRTEWNALRRFQGQSDIPLSDEGRTQAAATAGALASEPLEAIVSSDLSRAFETARVIAAHHDLEVVPDPRLREFAFGEWEGLTWDEIVARYPVAADMAFSSVRAYAPTGGERFDSVRARVGRVLDEFAGREGRVVFVTHAGALHALLDILVADQLDLQTVRLTPASITRIAMDSGKARLMSLDDVRHLD